MLHEDWTAAHVLRRMLNLGRSVASGWAWTGALAAVVQQNPGSTPFVHFIVMLCVMKVFALKEHRGVQWSCCDVCSTPLCRQLLPAQNFQSGLRV